MKSLRVMHLLERCGQSAANAIHSPLNNRFRHDTHSSRGRKAGLAVWNAWAAKARLQLEVLQRRGHILQEIKAGENLSAWILRQEPQIRTWLYLHTINFGSHYFGVRGISEGRNTNFIESEAGIDFRGFTFPGPVNFFDATFCASADFSGTTFEGPAVFASAYFAGRANFDGAVFNEGANFAGSRFQGDASFNKVILKQGAKFDGAEFKGKAACTNLTCLPNAPLSFGHASFEGMADFGHLTCGGSLNFESAQFSQMMCFDWASIGGNANFAGTVFKGGASFADAPSLGRLGTRFQQASFSGGAYFDRSRFPAATNFIGARFEAEASFADTRFRGDAHFDGATFSGFASFGQAAFAEIACFTGVLAERGFSLFNTEFRKKLPDFTLAHFQEAPQISGCTIPQAASYFWWRLISSPLRAVLFWASPAKDKKNEGEKYQALKRIAIAGNDHRQELEMFAGELQNRGERTIFWFLRELYGLLSNYGRSVWMPIAWFVAFIFIFAASYLYLHLHFDGGPRYHFPNTFPAWLVHTWHNSKASACMAGSGSMFEASFRLSLRKGLIFWGETPSQLERHYACLYGLERSYLPGEAGQTAGGGSRVHEKWLPKIPFAADALSILQSVISAVLLYLTLLAVRNNFRLK
jgi:uncharacterized protein YjbI with pentapeptide repeats